MRLRSAPGEVRVDLGLKNVAGVTMQTSVTIPDGRAVALRFADGAEGRVSILRATP